MSAVLGAILAATTAGLDLPIAAAAVAWSTAIVATAALVAGVVL